MTVRPTRRGTLAAATLLVAAACACTSASGPSDSSSGQPSALNPNKAQTTLTFPSGDAITVELAIEMDEIAQGMMFRPNLRRDEGLLFIFPSMERREFWMYRTEVPLDIIWLDDGKRIVEIVRNAQPCRSVDARDCPTYGGSAASNYVLELAAGQADARNLKIGDELQF